MRETDYYGEAEMTKIKRVRSGGRRGEGVLAPNQPAASWIYE